MSTKHVFNSSEGLVLKSLRGAVALNPALRLHAPSKTVYHVPDTSRRSDVKVISGGGGGHEPAHAGYTGCGMLAASVAGDVFASPSAGQVFTAVQLALLASGALPSSAERGAAELGKDEERGKEVLLIINNYTGDRLNFGLGAERARATLGARVESVVVADDVSLLDQDPPSLVGPRGLAGNILVCKLLGAAASCATTASAGSEGMKLADLKALGDAVVGSLASVGVGLGHCHVPGRDRGEAGEEGGLKDGECELGLGLHNEPGARKMTVGSAEGLVRAMLDAILGSGTMRGKVNSQLLGRDGKGEENEGDFVQRMEGESDGVVLYVNNLGGMSQLEMGAIVDEILNQLENLDIHPKRIYCHAFMTSLNAPGFSISVLNVSAVVRRLGGLGNSNGRCLELSVEEILSFLDAPTDASAWLGVRSWPTSRRDRRREEREIEELIHALSPLSDSPAVGQVRKDTAGSEEWRSLIDVEPALVDRGVRQACEAVLASESELTQYDTVVGDGDCGATFASGAKAVLNALDNGDVKIENTNPAAFVGVLAGLLEGSMGVFGLFFTALSRELGSDEPARAAPRRALTALSAHTPARPGDRTLVDALQPFCDALAGGEGLGSAVEAARKGAEKTKGMRPRLGRATYVPVNDSEAKVPPDPGACGVAVILEGFERGISGGLMSDSVPEI